MHLVLNLARITIWAAALPYTVAGSIGETPAESGSVYTLAGIVANSATGAPIARALVSVQCFGTGGVAMDGVLTDGSGGFRFTGLPQGRCMLSSKRPGFEDGHSEDTAGLVVGPSRENLRIGMKPVTVITGRVLDRRGDPVAGLLVQALLSRIDEGRRESKVYAWATTDDKGHYRLGNLWQGPFYVRVVGRSGMTRYMLGDVLPQSGEGESFAPVYYQNASDLASAVVIPASPGEELHADLTITMEPGFRIRGTIGGFAPNRPAEIELLRGKDDFATGRVLLNTATAQFEIHDVTAGSYLLRITQSGGDQKMRAILPVNITGDMTGLRPELLPGVDVVFQFHGDSEEAATDGPEDDGQVGDLPGAASVGHLPRRAMLATVQLRAEDDPKSEMYFARPDEQGTMQVDGVLPGRYSIVVAPFSGYTQSIICGTSDLTETAELDVPAGTAPAPVEVTIRSDGGSVGGTVTSAGKPSLGATVILVSASRVSSIVGPMNTNAQGKFTMLQVPPGNYVAWAWRAGAEVEYLNPAALQALGTAPVNVTVTANGKQTIELAIPEGGK